MPMLFLEAPAGIRRDAKTTMMKEVTAALDEAFHVPDVRIFLREYPAENVGQDGRIQSELMRPVAILETPPLASLGAKRKMVERIHGALAEAYRGIANTSEIMVFINHYPLENVGWAGRLQSDNPEIVEAVKQLNE